MSFNNLKPAWQQYKLENSLDKADIEGILQLIDAPQASAYSFNITALINGLLLPLLFVCCQGG